MSKREKTKKKTSRDKKTFSNDIHIYNPRRRKQFIKRNEMIISRSKWIYIVSIDVVHHHGSYFSTFK
jgi:hypothetical protein